MRIGRLLVRSVPLLAALYGPVAAVPAVSSPVAGASSPRQHSSIRPAAAPPQAGKAQTQSSNGDGVSGGPSSARSAGLVDEVPPASDFSELAALIDGPPPPAPPEVQTRDERGRVTIRAIRLTRSLRMDGNLDEHVYETVKPVTGFIQNVPDVGKPASQKTDAWVFFDENNVYVSARCWDTAPESEWVADDMRRDSIRVNTNNDNFGVTLDTFYDRRNGFRFYTNPLGTVAEVLVAGEGNINRDWNTVWDVRTGRFEGGWTVEMQLPFKSLRYRPGASQLWGIQMRRSIRRRNEFAFLTPLPATTAGTAWNRISMSAALVGLEAPPLSRRLEIKPYGITGFTTDNNTSPVVSNDMNGDFGIDAKYGLTKNLTFDFTYNTDFAQVEVDEQQVNLTRFSLFFPEKRDFFLEGKGIFEFGRGNGMGMRGGTAAPELFFTRRIGLSGGREVPILGGARLTGKVGNLTVGALNIRTKEEPVSGSEPTSFTVLRLSQDILRRSSVGMIYTDRSRSALVRGESNRAYGVDAAFSFYENVNFNGFYARNDTRGLAGRRQSYQGRIDYNADRYGFELDHLYIGDAFNPEMGFVRRDDMRRTVISARFSPRPKKIRKVRRFSWDGSVEYIENTAGELETRQQSFGFDTEFQSSDRFNIDISRNYEFLPRPFRLVNRVTVPVGGYGFDRFRASYALGQQRRLAGTFSVSVGSFYDGDQTTIGFSSGRVKITRQLTVEPSVSVDWIKLPYGSITTQLYRTRADYAFTPRMFFTSLLQYNSSNDTISTNLRLRWEYSPGSDLFVVYTEERDSDVPGGQFSALMNRAFVVKFNRLLRF